MTTTTNVDLIPRDILFGNPVKTSPQVSPDGRRMAYLAPVNNVLNVWVGTIGQDDYRSVTNDVERGIRFYAWAADNKHILYLQDVGGNENWRLYATNLESQETRDLTPFENVQARVIDRDKHFPNELLIGMNKDNPQVHDVYHLDIASGAITVIAEDPEYDVASTMIHPDTREIQAVAFDRDRLEWSVLDDSIKGDFEYIRSLHRGDFSINSRDDADATWIVAFTVDNGPVPFYAYDCKTRTATFLFDNQPALNEYTLATMEPFSFTSRDGQTIHGYLTLPPGE